MNTSSTLANYMMWHSMNGGIRFMPESYQELRRELRKVLYGITSASSQWSVCVARTDAAFGFATGALYVEQAFSQGEKDEVSNCIFSILKTVLCPDCSSNYWENSFLSR